MGQCCRIVYCPICDPGGESMPFSEVEVKQFRINFTLVNKMKLLARWSEGCLALEYRPVAVGGNNFKRHKKH